jgi:hypothetical protein
MPRIGCVACVCYYPKACCFSLLCFFFFVCLFVFLFMHFFCCCCFSYTFCVKSVYMVILRFLF